MLAELQTLAERVRLCQQRLEEEKQAFEEVSLPYKSIVLFEGLLLKCYA